MKSGAVDADRFKTEGRQPMNRRKISKNNLVLNGADECLNYAAVDESVVRQVNLAAAYHDHISCTKSADLCHKVDGPREGRGALPCESDHIYANCSEIKTKSSSNNNNKDLKIENNNLREMIITHIDLINELQEKLAKQSKHLSEQEKESEDVSSFTNLQISFEYITANGNLKALLFKKEQNMCLQRRNYPKSEEDSAENVSEVRSNLSDNGHLSTTAYSIGQIHLRTPHLATRYFGRRSKTVPSRALKRRYMGPPKSFPKQAVAKTASSRASVSSASELQDSDRQETLGQTEIREDGVRRARKRRGRRPKRMARKVDFLTTDKAYFLPDFRSPPNSLDSFSEIDVPLWKLKPVTSFYQMEGTENINDPVFSRRHTKFELDERRRKRWDMQRMRDQKTIEKKLAREREHAKKRKSQSFFPDPRHIEYIEVTEQLPVLAFGHVIPLFQPCEFSLPWRCEDNPVTDPPPQPPVVKAKRGRPPTPGPKVT
ncbi:male-specific lethal 1-like 1 [Trichonephila clavata]|uniref:Male-specific lethal 1-like 1 n=1 Tax=Trichonephila clavata TaxID=2740835 RepID=A0A8X6KUW3_TRICU|nr:male-specific lethal 1-like 1 [Trichonephila clavata]